MIDNSLISTAYLEEQKYLHFYHSRWDFYGTGGPQWAAEINRLGCRDLLDYGCGKGYLRKMLSPDIAVHEYDPAIEKFSALPGPAELVVCLDVLEHIEPELMGRVLDHLTSLARRLLFVSISTKETARKLRDGRNAHLIVQSGKWWRRKIEKRGFSLTRIYPTNLQEFAALFTCVKL